MAKTQNSSSIMIVDDDNASVLMLSTALAGDYDYNMIHKCGDGVEALRLIGIHNLKKTARKDHVLPDVMLLDIVLPGINGFEVCRLIKEEHPQIQIMLMTAYEIEDIQSKVLDSNADSFLHKPYKVKELLTRVRILAGKSRRLRDGGEK